MFVLNVFGILFWTKHSSQEHPFCVDMMTVGPMIPYDSYIYIYDCCFGFKVMRMKSQWQGTP